MALSVLHVTQVGDYGVAQYLRDLAVAQVTGGVEVTIAGDPDSWLAGEVVRVGAGWRSWPATRAPGLETVREARRLARIVADVDPDVVHLHSAKAGLAGRLAVRGARPTIFQPHGWSFFAVGGARSMLARTWERFAARWTSSILCVSGSERAHGEAAGVRGPWCVVPTGVDTERFAPADRADARREVGLGEGPVAVCVARLAIAQKAQDVLIEAWRLVERGVPDASLILVGDGPDRTALEAASSPSVRFVGARDDVPTWLRAADVVTLPSRYEGLSLAVLEAMACGRSVVVTDCVGMREAVGDGGAVVPIDDVRALASALEARLRDRFSADAEGVAGRQRVLERYTRGAWSDAVLEATRRAAGSGAQGDSTAS